MNKEPKKKSRSYKSPKGALIKGMSKELPSEILSDPVFKKKLRELLRGYSGIYALYKGKKLYYVGLTGNLHGRISWHLRDRHSGKWDHFKIFRIQRASQQTKCSNLEGLPCGAPSITASRVLCRETSPLRKRRNRTALNGISHFPILKLRPNAAAGN